MPFSLHVPRLGGAISEACLTAKLEEPLGETFTAVFRTMKPLNRDIVQTGMNDFSSRRHQPDEAGDRYGDSLSDARQRHGAVLRMAAGTAK